MPTSLDKLVTRILADIEFLRNKHKLTKIELCRRADINTITYADYLKGRSVPKIHTLHKLCVALDAELVMGVVDKGLWETEDNVDLVKKQARGLYKW